MSEHNRNHFDHLLSLFIEDEATDKDIDALIKLIKDELHLKHELHHQLQLDSLLKQTMEEDLTKNSFSQKVVNEAYQTRKPSEFVAGVLDALPDSNTNTRDKVSSVLPWTIALVSLAACFIFAFIVGITTINQRSADPHIVADREAKDNGIAVVVELVDYIGSHTLSRGNSVNPGTLLIKNGFVELEFYRGARLKITAPAKLDLINAERIYLHEGKVMTDVPSVAIGFTIDTPNSEVVDLGTAIGVNVDKAGNSEVHVFDGLVEARAEAGYAQLIRKGEAMTFDGKNSAKWRNLDAQSNTFSEFNHWVRRTSDDINSTMERWLASRKNIMSDPSLVSYFDFEPNTNEPRILNNLAQNDKKFDGAIVGARWESGPWPGKKALGFKRAGDRVRVDLDFKLESFTLSAWVGIDSLDRLFNSILLTDGYKPGDLHWQIGQWGKDSEGSGRMFLGMNAGKNKGKNYYSKPFFSLKESGRWYHLAVTMDKEQQVLGLYIDGQKIAEEPVKHTRDFWHIGKASIGNWEPLHRKISPPVRNMNGSFAELAIFSRALSSTEIKRLALSP